MSEIKGEVEYVIKTGRQVVEKKQVDFPDKLSAQLDAIKQQFNELGTQVTHGKGDLEKALKLAKKLRRETNTLKEFSANLEQELNKIEAVKAPRDIEAELKWIEGSMCLSLSLFFRSPGSSNTAWYKNPELINIVNILFSLCSGLFFGRINRCRSHFIFFND